MVRLSPWLVENHVLLLCGHQGLVQAPPAGPGCLAGLSVPFPVPLADSPREGQLGAPALGVHPAEEAGRGLLWRGVGRAVEEHGARGHQDH